MKNTNEWPVEKPPVVPEEVPYPKVDGDNTVIEIPFDYLYPIYDKITEPAA